MSRSQSLPFRSFILQVSSLPCPPPHLPFTSRQPSISFHQFPDSDSWFPLKCIISLNWKTNKRKEKALLCVSTCCHHVSVGSEFTKINSRWDKVHCHPLILCLHCTLHLLYYAFLFYFQVDNLHTWDYMKYRASSCAPGRYSYSNTAAAEESPKPNYLHGPGATSKVSTFAISRKLTEKTRCNKGILNQVISVRALEQKTRSSTSSAFN